MLPGETMPCAPNVDLQDWAAADLAPEGKLRGRVSFIGDKVAFIDCPVVKRQSEQDVFAPAYLLRLFRVGEEVFFRLLVNDQGQPQAASIVRAGQPDNLAMGVHATLTGLSFAGVISELGPKYAFISCSAVKAQYGMNVFCFSSFLRHCIEGDLVTFELAEHAGRPQAAHITRVTPKLAH